MRASPLRSVAVFLLSMGVALTVSGCYAEAVKVSDTDNAQIKAELLFTHDGCRIYRFLDGSRPIYYADCRAVAGPKVSTMWQQSCGKNCIQAQMMWGADGHR